MPAKPSSVRREALFMIAAALVGAAGFFALTNSSSAARAEKAALVPAPIVDAKAIAVNKGRAPNVGIDEYVFVFDVNELQAADFVFG